MLFVGQISDNPEQNRVGIAPVVAPRIELCKGVEYQSAQVRNQLGFIQFRNAVVQLRKHLDAA
jgi:hypothetical protein